MKNVLIIVGLLILLVAAFLLTQYLVGANIRSFFTPQKIVTAKIGGRSYKLIHARTDAEKQKGLSGTKSLGRTQGMLFVFDNPDYHAFWMKDMNFPIDIIFLNNNTVITIHKNAQPIKDNKDLPLYRPEQPSNQVIEINANQSEELGLKKGDTVEIDL